MTFRNAALLWLSLSCGLWSQTQTYKVNLTPPLSPGHSYAFNAEATEITPGPGGNGAETVHVVFSGEARIERVDDTGNASRIVFTAEKFHKTSHSEDIYLLKPGTLIVADSNEEPSVSLKEGPMPSEPLQAFGLLYSMHKPGRATNAQIFGTKEAKAIGQSWPLNTSLVAESLKEESHVEVPPGHLSGTVTLVSKEQIGGVECLFYQAKFHGDSFVMDGIPASASDMRGKFGEYVPIDPSQEAYRESAEMEADLKMANGAGSVKDLKFSLRSDQL